MRGASDANAIPVACRALSIVGRLAGTAIIGHAVTRRPLYTSKVNTVLQIVPVAITLLQGALGPAAPVVSGAPGALAAPNGLDPAGLGPLLRRAAAPGAAHVWNTARGDTGATSGPG